MPIRMFDEKNPTFQIGQLSSPEQLVQFKVNDPEFYKWAAANILHPNAYAILKAGKPLLAGTFYSACGKRMTLQWSAHQPHPAMASHKMLKTAEKLGANQRCLVLQTDILKATGAEVDTATSNGFYVSAISLTRGQGDETPSRKNPAPNFKYEKVNFDFAENLDLVCRLEIQQRWEFPWLTNPNVDNWKRIQEDYGYFPSATKSGNVFCIALNGDCREGFLLLLLNAEKQIAVVGYIFVAPHLRGQAIAQELFHSTYKSESLEGYQFIWMASVCNPSSLSTAVRLGFKSQKLFFQRDIYEF